MSSAEELYRISTEAANAPEQKVMIDENLGVVVTTPIYAPYVTVALQDRGYDVDLVQTSHTAVSCLDVTTPDEGGDADGY